MAASFLAISKQRYALNWKKKCGKNWSGRTKFIMSMVFYFCQRVPALRLPHFAVFGFCHSDMDEWTCHRNAELYLHGRSQFRFVKKSRQTNPKILPCQKPWWKIQPTCRFHSNKSEFDWIIEMQMKCCAGDLIKKATANY